MDRRGQYTILGFKQKKAAIKETFLTREGFMEAALSDEKMKKFAVMLNNNLYAFRIKKALHDDGAITDTALLYNDNVFELPLAKTNQKKEILISNSLLEIFDRYLLCEELIRKGDSITAFLVEHNDVLYKVIKANTTNDKRSHQTNIFKSSVQLTTRLTLYSRMK
jgi:hypothetical protein